MNIKGLTNSQPYDIIDLSKEKEWLKWMVMFFYSV